MALTRGDGGDCADGGAHRNVYLTMTSLTEARERFLGRLPWSGFLEAETVPVGDAVGRVLAAAVPAKLSAPTYHGAAMDGIAVRAADTFGASETAPRELSVPGQARFVNTGEPLPEGMDAVVMIERVQIVSDAAVRIEGPAFPWQHVRRVGEDIVATELLFVRGRQLGPYDVGALMAAGVFAVSVLRRPRVLIVPTGAELVAPEDVDVLAMPPGRIIDFNSTMLGEAVKQLGGVYVRHAAVADDLPRLTELVRTACSGAYDMVLVLGGSSAGSRDFTRAAVAAAGEVLVHGVTMMPGKPTVLGVCGSRPVIGVPGYPVSAILCFEQFVTPALCAMLGVPEPRRERIQARPTRTIASKLGMEEFIRVRLGRVGDRMVATPLPRGSGTVSSLVRADGMIRIPTELEGIAAGADVDVELLRPRAEIEGNVIAVGSHDLLMELLADLLRGRPGGFTLSSTHIGSLGGLRALRDGGCHLAPSHLLDPSDGSYNRSALARYCKGLQVRQLHLAQREQGLMVPPGNPAGLTGLPDLRREGLRFVNRQGGSGTRVLLDHELGRLGLDPAHIAGYGVEETTHMGVAVAVASGAADVGLGVRSAARALGVDFVPVTTEDYDLLIPEAFWEHPGIVALREVIGSAEFQAEMHRLGGYDGARTGHVTRLG